MCDKSDIVIERITEPVIAGFHACVDVVARERKYLVFLEAPPLADARSYVMGNIETSQPHFIARDGQKVIGWCDIIRKSRPVQQHCGILGMGLLPDYRGMGLGRHLITRCLAEAEQQGLVHVELTVHAGNSRARKLYESCGFVEEGVMRKANLIDGQFRDSIMMAKFFDPGL